MLFYIIKRALLMIPILLGITVLSFGVMRLAPGGPAEAQMEFLQRLPPRPGKGSASFMAPTSPFTSNTQHGLRSS